MGAHRNFELKIFLTYGKRRRQTGLSGTMKRSHLTIGLRNSETAVEVLVSGIRRYLPIFWLVSVAKDLNDTRRASYR